MDQLLGLLHNHRPTPRLSQILPQIPHQGVMDQLLIRHQAVRVPPLLRRILAPRPTQMRLCLGPRKARHHRHLLSL
jgi:hypothetical protein